MGSVVRLSSGGKVFNVNSFIAQAQAPHIKRLLIGKQNKKNSRDEKDFPTLT